MSSPGERRAARRGGRVITGIEADEFLQSGVLEDLGAAANYRSWLVSLALPYLGEDPLEVGSGIGDYAAEWAALGMRITASEAHDERLDALRQRFAGDPRVRVRRLAVPLEAEGWYSAVVAYNVLEHIPDDVGALRSFRRLVRPGGAVVLLVPAFPIAMSRFDRAIGHVRRYRRPTLLRALREAGLHPQRAHYVNSLGLLAWIAGMRIAQMTPRQGAVLTAWDRAVVPALRAVESRRPPPFGQSLFAVARAD